MAQILDEEFKRIQNEEKDETTSNIKLRVFIYFLVMLMVGQASYYFQYPYDFTFFASFREAVYYILVNLSISLFLESIRYLIRKIKERNTRVVSNQDPFWFKVIEGGFSIWILFFVSFVGVYIYKVHL